MVYYDIGTCRPNNIVPVRRVFFTLFMLFSGRGILMRNVIVLPTTFPYVIVGPINRKLVWFSVFGMISSVHYCNILLFFSFSRHILSLFLGVFEIVQGIKILAIFILIHQYCSTSTAALIR